MHKHMESIFDSEVNQRRQLRAIFDSFQRGELVVMPNGPATETPRDTKDTAASLTVVA